MVASSSCFAASIRAKREYIGKSTNGPWTVRGQSSVRLSQFNNLILRRIRIWWYRQFIFSNRDYWTRTSWYKGIEFWRNCPRPGLPTQSKFKTSAAKLADFEDKSGRRLTQRVRLCKIASGEFWHFWTFFVSFSDIFVLRLHKNFRGLFIAWVLIMKLRICCNWQFASTVVTIATDTTWNIVAMWHHDQQIALIHHDLNKEWTWDLICIIRKSFEIFILFKLKIHYSLSVSLLLISVVHSSRLSV